MKSITALKISLRILYVLEMKVLNTVQLLQGKIMATFTIILTMFLKAI